MPQSHIFDPSFPDVERPGCPNAVRQCGCRTSHPTDHRAKGAPWSASVRLLGRGHCPLRRRLSPPQVRVKSRGAHGTRPTNRLVSPRGEKRGVGLGRKANQKFWVMIVAFAAVAAWQIYDMATATETPSRALMVLQYVLLAGLLVGLAGALLNFIRSQ